MELTNDSENIISTNDGKNIKYHKDKEALEVTNQAKRCLNKDTLYKLKLFLDKVKDFPEAYFHKNSFLIKGVKEIHHAIFKNLHNGDYYTIFAEFKELLEVFIREDNLREHFGFKQTKLTEEVQMLSVTLTDIIETQKKRKNTRRNLKNKLRLQRRLNELTVACEELMKQKNPEDIK